MTSTIVPGVDLVPAVSSRVVTIATADLTEGLPIPGATFTFTLSSDLDVAADGRIISSAGKTVTLDANGQGSIRLPTYDPDALTPLAGDRDWAVIVKSSIGYCKAFRVPAGSTAISLAALPPVRELRGREKQWAITGVEVTVTTGSPAAGSGRVRNGILELDFTLPMGNSFVKGVLTNGADFDTVTEPGLYTVSGSNTYLNPPPIYAAGQAGMLVVWGSGNGWGGQEYIRHGGNLGERVWRGSRTVGTWNPWQRPRSDWGRIPDGTNIDTLRAPGEHRIEGAGHAGTLTGLPPGVTTGTLVVYESGQLAGMMQTQVVYGAARSGVWSRTALNTAGDWTPWIPLTSDWGNLPGYTDIDTVRNPGSYRISGATVAGTLVNSPITDNAATLVVYETGQAGGLMQTQLMLGAGGRGLWQRHVLTTAGTWSPWVDLLESTQNYWAQHTLRVQAFRRRRGGVIGTSGVGAVAIRFDHNFDHFMTKIAPLVEQYGIVSSMAVPGMEFDPAYRNASTVNTWADMERWALRHGMEIMCHSYSHDDAQTLGQLDNEIRYSRLWLENRMPGIKVDVWAQPGVATAEGKTAYMGMDRLTRPESIYSSRAGRMLIGNYAVVGGHGDGYFRELTGDVDQALAHHTIEAEATAAPVISMIDQAAATGTGLVLMMHPNVIGTTGYMSTAVLGQIFAHIAMRRDQGRLQNLTVGGMSLADSSADRRRNIAENSFFVNGLDGWTGTGWTVVDGYALSPTTAAVLSQGRYWSRRAALAGTWHELVAEVSSAGAAASVTARVWDNQNATLLDQSRTVALPTNGSRALVRIPFGIPYVAGAEVPTIQPSWSLARASGAQVRVHSIRVQAI